MPGTETTKNQERHRIAPPELGASYRTKPIGINGSGIVYEESKKYGGWVPQSVRIGKHDTPAHKKELRAEAKRLIKDRAGLRWFNADPENFGRGPGWYYKRGLYHWSIYGKK